MPWDGVERRRVNRMVNNFEPQTAFEGYVAAKLETIEKKFNDLPCPESFKRLNKVENELSNIKGKAGIIGIVTGFVGAFVWKHITGK